MSISLPTSRRQTFRGLDFWWLVVLILATQLVYIAGVTSWYCGDDFQYVLSDPSSRIFHYFANPNFGHGFYRPVSSAVNALVQVLVGWETWPIHILNALAHAFLAWMVYRLILRGGYGRSAAVIGSVFMAISQGGSAAVLQTDTFSQITGALFGCLSLWFLHATSPPAADGEDEVSETPARRGHPLAYHLASLLCFALSLLSKETSVGFAPMVGLLVLLRHWKTPHPLVRRLLRMLLEILPYVVLSLLYLWLRGSIGLSQPTAGGEGYTFGFGMNVLRNLLQLGAVAVDPVSTVTTFEAVTNRDLLVLIPIATASLLLVVLVVVGLRGADNRRWLGFIGFCALAGTVPVVFLNHVGELYLYNSLPFVAVLVGVGLAGALGRIQGMLRRGVIAFLVLLGVLNANAIREKGVMITENGVRARGLLEQIAPYIKAMPKNGYLLLLNPPTGEISYSVYRMPGFQVFRYGTGIFPVRTGRGDVYVDCVEALDQIDSVAFRSASAHTMLTLQGDSVVPFTRPTSGE